MSTTKRRVPSCILIGLVLVVFPALIWSQNSAVSRSSFSMRFALSSSSNTTAKSTAGQVFIGRSEGGDARVESGFYIISVQRGSALAVGETYGLPTKFALHQNYPNPFNPSTTIKFDVPEATELTVVVYDLLGRQVVTLVEGTVQPGYRRVIWSGKAAHGSDVPSGLYIALMRTPKFTKSIKLILLK